MTASSQDCEMRSVCVSSSAACVTTGRTTRTKGIRRRRGEWRIQGCLRACPYEIERLLWPQRRL